jgi:hypothetical protein
MITSRSLPGRRISTACAVSPVPASGSCAIALWNHRALNWRVLSNQGEQRQRKDWWAVAYFRLSSLGCHAGTPMSTLWPAYNIPEAALRRAYPRRCCNSVRHSSVILKSYGGPSARAGATGRPAAPAEIGVLPPCRLDPGRRHQLVDDRLNRARRVHHCTHHIGSLLVGGNVLGGRRGEVDRERRLRACAGHL